MNKQLLFDENARRKIQEGINIVANAVKVTLGPKGRNVILDQEYGQPHITKDGVSVAKEIELKDRYQIYEATLPVLLTVLGDSLKPRYMNLYRLNNLANDTNIEVKGIADINLDPKETGLAGSPTKVKKSFSKVVNKQIELKEGTNEELAEEIVARLKSRNVL